jgi:acyl-CoA reductase-like NAD-dependent aldehyde dehydrogenase
MTIKVYITSRLGKFTFTYQLIDEAKLTAQEVALGYEQTKIGDIVSAAIVEYIGTKLGFGSVNFPLTVDFWKDKIKLAAENTETFTVSDQIALVNALCKNAFGKITKVSIDCSVL